MKIYIAGPMTGYPEHNFPAFHAAAEALRSLGHEVVSPAELDASDDHEALAAVPWDWYLRRDIKLLVDCEAICMLEGWERSKGATLERYIAKALGMKEMRFSDYAPT